MEAATKIFSLNSYPANMINIVKKYLWRKIHELITLIKCSDDS